MCAFLYQLALTKQENFTYEELIDNFKKFAHIENSKTDNRAVSANGNREKPEIASIEPEGIRPDLTQTQKDQPNTILSDSDSEDEDESILEEIQTMESLEMDDDIDIGEVGILLAKLDVVGSVAYPGHACKASAVRSNRPTGFARPHFPKHTHYYKPIEGVNNEE